MQQCAEVDPVNVRSLAQAKITPKPSFTPARTTLLQRKCACGGTPCLDGECAECRQKRLSRRRIGLPIGPWRASTTTHKDPRHRRAGTRYKSEWCSARSIQSRLFTEVPRIGIPGSSHAGHCINLREAHDIIACRPPCAGIVSGSLWVSSEKRDT